MMLMAGAVRRHNNEREDVTCDPALTAAYLYLLHGVYIKGNDVAMEGSALREKAAADTQLP